MLAIRNDEELIKMYRRGHFNSGGTLPAIHTFLLPRLDNGPGH
jgi:hypothetical protein